MKLEKMRWFQPENAPKAFGGRAAPPGPAGGAYSAPLAGFKG